MRRENGGQFDLQTYFPGKNSGAALLDYRRGEVIYQQGDLANSAYYIQSGKIKLTILSDRGKEAVVAILEPGQFFGESCLLGIRRRVASSSAMTDATVARVTRPGLTRALRSQPGFSELFIGHLLKRNLRAHEDLADQLFNSSERRLARTLLRLANFDKDGKPQSVAIRISQETLAEMVGTTRSRVNFFMNRFRRQGLIDYNGHIEVRRALLDLVKPDEPRSPRV